MKKLTIARLFALGGMAVALTMIGEPVLAQGPDRLPGIKGGTPPGRGQIEQVGVVRCNQGFSRSDSGKYFTCRSVQMGCGAGSGYQPTGHRVEGNRFVYDCIRPPT